MTSMEEVAKKAKVSVTTVSRALNDHPYVSEKTKKKIYKAMEELNYYPNNVAQQLRGKKTKMIGVIISYITNPFFAYLVDAIEKKNFGTWLSPSGSPNARKAKSRTILCRINTEKAIRWNHHNQSGNCYS